MACPIIIRRHDGIQSYLVLDPNNPRELLRHWGLQNEFFIRPWLGPWTPPTPWKSGAKCWPKTWIAIPLPMKRTRIIAWTGSFGMKLNKRALGKCGQIRGVQTMSPR